MSSLQETDLSETCFTVCENNVTEVLESAALDQKEVIKLRFLSSSLAWFVDLFIADFEERHQGKVKVEFVNVPLGQLWDDTINEAKSQIGLYDGFVVQPLLMGSVVEYQGWADLTPYINESADHIQDWADIMTGVRQNFAQYEKEILMYPLDGDLLHMFYRRDILEHFGYDHPPRTWDEYEQIAQATHGKVYENTTLIGSCVGRMMNCACPYWANLVLASLTQAKGTWEGHLFDTDDMAPLTGPALEQAIKWLENQVRFGAPNEFDGCITGVNFVNMRDEGCVLTYNWGNSFKRYLQENDKLLGRFAIAPTPGSTKILDRETKRLVNCTEDTCPYGDYYPDIGWVNRAPYAAFGGWACSVNNYTDPVKKRLATEFCHFVSSNSKKTVIPPARGEHTGGQDPFRYSHLDVELYAEQGYERDVAQEFVDTIENGGLDSPNVVIDIRFPKATDLNRILEVATHDHLNATRLGLISANNRQAARVKVAEAITKDWQDAITTYNAEGSTRVPLLESYQRLRGIYSPDIELKQLGSIRYYGYTLAAIILFLSLAFGAWTHICRQYGAVRAAQPFFLVMICCGTLIMGSAIFPLTIDDGNSSVDGASAACVAFPWLLAYGWSIVFAALFAKLWRLNRVFESAVRFQRVVLTNKDVLWPFGILFTINTVLLTVWTAVDPLQWERVWISETESYGTCSLDNNSTTWKVVLPLLGVFNFAALVLANVQAYKARAISTEYGESAYIGIIMMCFLQVVLVGFPTLFLVDENPTVSFLLKASIIFLLCMSVLLCLFVPKIITWRQSSQGKDRDGATSSFQERYSTTAGGGSFAGHASIRGFNQSTNGNQIFLYKTKMMQLYGFLEQNGEIDVNSLFEKLGVDKDTGSLRMEPRQSASTGASTLNHTDTSPPTEDMSFSGSLRQSTANDFDPSGSSSAGAGDDFKNKRHKLLSDIVEVSERKILAAEKSSNELRAEVTPPDSTVPPHSTGAISVEESENRDQRDALKAAQGPSMAKIVEHEESSSKECSQEMPKPFNVTEDASSEESV